MNRSILSFLIFSFFSFSSIANAEWTGSYKVKHIKAQTNGIYLVLGDFRNQSESVSCKYNTLWMDDVESVNYEARLSVLLTAFTTDIPVNISYYECQGDHIKISSVSMEK
ncbi:hypothetical protein [Endozoicomonas arenosclerae]|uniref:hypothetical protein n=1 Tax=Endozoicomonas arenosclerae TaxID=1633495 RepID=UPI000A83C121|nr:hypothetical protein [Endozoicomonas arenosclerae]